jgi:hypothetical protein
LLVSGANDWTVTVRPPWLWELNDYSRTAHASGDTTELEVGPPDDLNRVELDMKPKANARSTQFDGRPVNEAHLVSMVGRMDVGSRNEATILTLERRGDEWRGTGDLWGNNEWKVEGRRFDGGGRLEGKIGMPGWPDWKFEATRQANGGWTARLPTMFGAGTRIEFGSGADEADVLSTISGMYEQSRQSASRPRR